MGREANTAATIKPGVTGISGGGIGAGVWIIVT
jgi:hypothetical protein